MTEILTKVVATIVTASFLIYLLKKFIERWLESFFNKKIELLKHENQKNLLEIQSTLNSTVYFNQQIFNEQFKVFREFSNHVYRCRNKVRSIYGALTEHNLRQNEMVHPHIENNIGEVSSMIASYRELLFSNRLLLDDEFFDELHAFIKNIEDLKLSLQLYSNGKDSLNDCHDRIATIYTRIDKSYPSIISNLRNGLGIKILDQMS
jgi:hypothetical protein